MKNLNFRYLLVGIIAFVVLFCNVALAQKNYHLAIETLDQNDQRTYKMELSKGIKKVTTLAIIKNDSLAINVKCFEDSEFTVLSDLQPTHIEIGKMKDGKYLSLGTYPNDIVIATNSLGVLENEALFITTTKFDKDSGKLQRCLGLYLLN